ncbi:MAG: MMPL family transporter [Demequinaceae bacterium]|nr:MMPL family transporter [Demequinaceae bacterium]
MTISSDSPTIKTWLRPAIIIGLAAVWLAIGGGLGGSSIPKLSEEQEFDQAAFLPQKAESTEADAERALFDPAISFSAILFLDSVTGDEQVTQLGDFTRTVLEEPLVEGGPTIGDLTVGETFVARSADGKAAIAIVEFDFDRVLDTFDGEFAAQIIAEEFRAAWDDAGIEGDFYLTGGVGVFGDLIGAFGGIDSLLILVALAVVLAILLLVYRSPVLPFFVLTGAVVGLGTATLAVLAMARAGMIDLNGQSQGIMFILVVGATTDYSLLLVARYREELRRYASPYDAMKRAWSRSFAPITASAITVMLALLTLLFSNLTSNQALGPVAAMGIASAYITTLTFLPAILLLGGSRARWAFWPKKPTFHPEDVGHVDTLKAVEKQAGLWGRISRGVATHPRRVWIGALAGLGFFALFLPTFKASGVGDSDQVLGDVESIIGLEVLTQHFDAGTTSPIEIQADEALAAEVSAAALAVDGVSSAYVLTPLIVAGMPPALASDDPIVIDGRVAIDAVTTVAASTNEAKTIVEDIRVAVHAVDPSALVGGEAAVALDINKTTDRDITVIIPLVLLVILLTLMVLLRAIVAPILIVAANVLSFAATLGLSALVFNHLFHFPGSDSAVPLFAFVFLVALGVDYSIFLMSRAREESLQRGTREGIRRSLAVTGGVITSAGIVLAATFGALVVLPLLFLVQMAFIVAAGVLIDTLVVRTLLLPGLIYDIDRVSWWPWHARIKA